MGVRNEVELKAEEAQTIAGSITTSLGQPTSRKPRKPTPVKEESQEAKAVKAAEKDLKAAKGAVKAADKEMASLPGDIEILTGQQQLVQRAAS